MAKGRSIWPRARLGGAVFGGVSVAAFAFVSWTVAGAPRRDDSSAVPSQPAQPTSGPGSSDYAHAAIQHSRHGTGAGRYWLFTPDEPRPARAPVVVLLHGWGGTDPTAYGAWIKHLVRRGNIVIFPRYQEDLRTLPREMTGHAVTAIRDALVRLDSSGPVHPNLTQFAIVGHSMGAIMSANIANRAARLELPTPRALFLAEPAFEPLVASYDDVAPETRLLIVVGADVRRDSSARRIFTGTSRVLAENKNYVTLFSDDHGSPPLVSDHFAPCAADSLGDDPDAARREWRDRTRDALDYFGYWKLCDGLLDTAFFGRHREFAFGNTPEVRFMGRWSDGTPVREAVVVSEPE